MKKSMLLVYAIFFLIAVGIAYAGEIKGNLIAMKDDKSSVTVIFNNDHKEHQLECDKGVVRSDVKIGERVKVFFNDEANTTKPRRVIPDPGC
jgi:hypothetical protein